MMSRSVLFMFVFAAIWRNLECAEVCSPCCSPLQMEEAVKITSDGSMIVDDNKSSQCHIALFNTPSLHKALSGKWLYFVGDSSTRGFFLALYYALLGATEKLSEVDFPVVDGKAPAADKGVFELKASMLRDEVLFRYGNRETVEECKSTLRSLGRGIRQILDQCDDHGDPCVKIPSSHASSSPFSPSTHKPSMVDRITAEAPKGHSKNEKKKKQTSSSSSGGDGGSSGGSSGHHHSHHSGRHLLHSHAHEKSSGSGSTSDGSSGSSSVADGSQRPTTTTAAETANVFDVEDVVTVKRPPSGLSFLEGLSGEVAEVATTTHHRRGLSPTVLVAFPKYYNLTTGQEVDVGLSASKLNKAQAGTQKTFELPVESLWKDEAQHDRLRCKRSRGATHSISSLHLGFLDAGFCDGKLVFSKVSPHDYTEGQMVAPMGAQVFPERAREFAKRMRKQEGGEQCVRVTFRMLPQVKFLLSELEALDGDEVSVVLQQGYQPMGGVSSGPASTSSTYVSSSLDFDSNSNSAAGSNSNGWKKKRKRGSSYFLEAAGDTPDLVYFQAGAWDRSMGCLLRRDYLKHFRFTALRLAAAAPGSAFVMGTLPTGPAYPANPRQEVERLGERFSAEYMKAKAAQCLMFTPPASEPGYSPEEVVREMLLGRAKLYDPSTRRDTLPLKENVEQFPELERWKREEKEARGANEAQQAKQKTEKGAASNKNRGRRQLLRARPGSAVEVDAAQIELNATAVRHNPRDVWIIDRGSSRAALPSSLAKGGDPSRPWGEADENFRRLHPAMIQNVWDVNRLVTGLMATPAFTKSRRSQRHGDDGEDGGDSDSGGGGGGGGGSAHANQDWCGCRPQLQVLNPKHCAPTEIMKPLDPDWPMGYPIKGRLVHWAEPCALKLSDERGIRP